MRVPVILMVLLSVIPVSGVSATPARQGQVQTTSSEQDDLRELERIQAERQRAASLANQGNPLAAGFDPMKALGTSSLFSGAGSGAGPGTQAELDGFFKMPVGQRALQVLADPRFARTVAEVRESPNRMNFIYVECGWFVLILVLRLWRSAVLTHWALRLWMRVWTGLLLLAGSVAVIPGLTIGMAYYRALGWLMMIFGFSNPFPGP